MKGLKAIKTEDEVTTKLVLLSSEEARLYYDISGSTYTMIDMIVATMIEDPTFAKIVRHAVVIHNEHKLNNKKHN